MAFSSSLLSEDQLLCSVCLDVFTDPVSTPCGHNFCMICLRECWNTSSPCQCPVCKERFSSRPQLRVNTFISELTAHYRRSLQARSGGGAEPGSSRPPEESCTEENLEDSRSRPGSCDPQRTADKNHKSHQTAEEEGRLRKSQLEMKRAEVQRMIRVRMDKMKEFKHSVQINANYKEKEAVGGAKVFSDLIGCIERRQAEFLDRIEEQHRAANDQAADLIRNLEREVAELRGGDAELEDPRRLLQNEQFLSTAASGFEKWTDACEETLRRALFQVQESVQEEISKLDKIKLKRIRRYAVDVTLNPDTAHPYLRLSSDGRRLTCSDTSRDVPNNPERFDRCPCVLGVEGFSSGRFHFRVHVGGKTDWDVGVAGERAERKGMITACPGNGFWSVCLRNSTQYMACDSRWVSLPLKAGPRDVGVFVDYEQGVVDFYDLSARSLMYSFTGQTFTQKLHPYFSPCLKNGGRNDAPLIIAPAEER